SVRALAGRSATPAAGTLGAGRKNTGDRLMVRRHGRAAAIAAACTALAATLTPVAAQHEHHGVPAGGAQVVLTGTAHGAEGTPLSGAIVRLLQGSGPEPHPMAASITRGAARWSGRRPPPGRRGRTPRRGRRRRAAAPSA